MAEEIAAIYCRLSQDDGSVGESGSIQTQENICQGGFHPKDEIPYKLEFIKSAALQRPYSNPCHT